MRAFCENCKLWYSDYHYCDELETREDQPKSTRRGLPYYFPDYDDPGDAFGAIEFLADAIDELRSELEALKRQVSRPVVIQQPPVLKDDEEVKTNKVWCKG